MSVKRLPRKKSKWSSEEILARFDKEGVPCAPIIDRSELLAHEQVVANGSIDRLQFEEFGEVRQARHPARFDKTPASVSRPAPRLGEHGREILAAIGYDDEAIESLISAGRVLGGGQRNVWARRVWLSAGAGIGGTVGRGFQGPPRRTVPTRDVDGLNGMV